MTCREIIDFLMEYLDRDLPAAERAEFEAHLKLCPPCVDFLRTYEVTRKLECKCYSDEPADAIPEQLVQAILAAKKKAANE